MVEFKINPEKTALLIIDMSNAFVSPQSPLVAPDGLSLVPRLNRLIDSCRAKGIPIIFTTQVFRRNDSDIGMHTIFRPEVKIDGILIDGYPGVEIYAEMHRKEDDILIKKCRFSAFVGTELDMILRSQGIDTLIIAGCVTNMCCECTARDARMRDYKVIFLSDGNAPRAIPDRGWGEVSGEEVQRVVLATMAFGYAEVLPVAEVIRQLSRL